MVKAFEAPGDPVQTTRTIGEVRVLGDDSFIATIDDEDGDLVQIRISLENIVESEKPRIVKGIMFFCDVEVVPEGQLGSIRGIEFSDELTVRETDWRMGVLFQTMANAETRQIPEEK